MNSPHENKSEWLLESSMRSKELSFIFPIIGTVKTFSEITQLITHILFCALYCLVHLPPFVFLGGLQIGIWILRSIQDPHHLRASSAFWSREAYRKWECASLQTVWGVVEGRMLIKIINNCWKEQWITPPLSDRPGMLLELAALAPLPQTLQMIPCHEIHCWNFSRDR